MSLGRFKDTWVTDRVMFEYVNQGGCSCCGAAACRACTPSRSGLRCARSSSR